MSKPETQMMINELYKAYIEYCKVSMEDNSQQAMDSAWYQRVAAIIEYYQSGNHSWKSVDHMVEYYTDHYYRMAENYPKKFVVPENEQRPGNRACL